MEFGHVSWISFVFIVNSNELQGKVVDFCVLMDLSCIHNEHQRHLLFFNGHWGTIVSDSHGHLGYLLVSTIWTCTMLQWTFMHILKSHGHLGENTNYYKDLYLLQWTLMYIMLTK